MTTASYDEIAAQLEAARIAIGFLRAANEVLAARVAELEQKLR